MKSIKETTNEGQYMLVEFNDDTSSFDELEILISRERLDHLIEIHQGKYLNATIFWDMLKRDLFGVNK
jgi:hypothetical protein